MRLGWSTKKCVNLSCIVVKSFRTNEISISAKYQIIMATITTCSNKKYI
jgi:hypothetical protein